jgi:hypothetical protein
VTRPIITTYSTSDPKALAAYRAAVIARDAFLDQLRSDAAELGGNDGPVIVFETGGPMRLAGLRPAGEGMSQGWAWRLIRGRLEPARFGPGVAAAQRWLDEHQVPGDCDPRYVLKAHGLAYQTRVGPLSKYQIHVPVLFEHDDRLWVRYVGQPKGDDVLSDEVFSITWEPVMPSVFLAAKEACEASTAADAGAVR